jgi:membrane-associated phospholipid phosphatase
VLLLALTLSRYFHRAHERFWSALATMVVPSGMLLNLHMKHIFQRDRPEGTVLDGLSRVLSFPSGQTMAATIVYGAVIADLLSMHKQDRGRANAVTAFLTKIVAVALSRVYLGVHYASDVLTAMFEGVAWLAVCSLFIPAHAAAPNVKTLCK